MATEFTPFPTPLTPPLTEEDKLSWLRLLRSSRVGISTFFRLMGEHGTAEASLAALPEVAAAAGVSKYVACSADAAMAEIETGQRAGAQLIAWGEAAYPEKLTTIGDPPPLLWAMGDRDLFQRPTVAMVGARNASSLGARMAKRIATDLSDAGYVVVSGLARGIDTASHLAALDGGTVAVMAGGVDVVYPAENAVLAQEIGEKGLRVSEQRMNMQPQARHFPRRNRLISGLTTAVVVIEAAAKSGSLITARTALDQGRDVLAVPGHPFDARASGCNMLLRDGAVLVRGADDVIEVLEMAEARANTDNEAEATSQSVAQVEVHVPQQQRTPAEVRQLHEEILQRLSPSPVAEDQLIRDVGASVQAVAPALVTLELEGRIRRQSGGMVALA